MRERYARTILRVLAGLGEAMLVSEGVVSNVAKVQWGVGQVASIVGQYGGLQRDVLPAVGVLERWQLDWVNVSWGPAVG